MPNTVPFSDLYRLLPIYIGKIPIRGKNLSVSFQLVLRVPPSPSQYILMSFVCLAYYTSQVYQKIQGGGVVGGSSGLPVCRLQLSGGNQSFRAWNGACPIVSSCQILYAVQNCYRIPYPISYFTTTYKPLLIESIQVISFMPALASSWSLAKLQLQNSSLWRTV